MKMGELNVEIEICCRAEFITYACEILRKSVKVFCRFLNFFTERGEKRVSGFQSNSLFNLMHQRSIEKARKVNETDESMRNDINAKNGE